jgi:putative phosphoribosyl transferase
VASGGVRVLNPDVVDALGIPKRVIDAVAGREQRDLERRELIHREGRPAPDVRGHTVILVDDGLATGSTMRAAAMALRQRQPRRLIIAVPVSSPETRDALRDAVDDIVCVITPEPFYAVGIWYQDFSQTSDAEVSDLSRRAGGERQRRAARSHARDTHNSAPARASR